MTEWNPEKIENAISILVQDCDTTRCIADKLISLACTGDHGAFSCPIARYINKITGQRVGASTKYVVAVGLNVGQVYLPALVSEFIRDFDLGHYPELYWHRNMK